MGKATSHIVSSDMKSSMDLITQARQNNANIASLQTQVNNNTSSISDNTQQIKDRSFSPTDKQFGAKFDGIADDTTALQSFFDYITTNGLKGQFPSGRTALISSAISVKGNPNWEIEGSNSTIKQKTNNTPILDFVSTASYANGIKLRGIVFDYVNTQPSTNTNALPIKLEAMVYESVFDKLTFNNGYYGIWVTDTTQNPWGNTFDNLWFNSGLSGGAMRMSALNAVPNNKFGRIFCSCQGMTQPVFNNLKGYNSVIDCIEFIATNNGVKLMTFQAGSKFEIGSLKLENGIYTSATNLFEFSTSSYIRIGSITIGGNQNMTINPSTGAVYVIRSSGSAPSAKVVVGHIELDGTSITNGYVFGSVGNSTLQTINIVNSGWSLTNVASDTACENVIVYDHLNNHLSTNKGDANYTVALGDANIVSFETTLTATRTVNLPSVNNNLFNGLKYRIRSYGAVNGTNVINIVCNGVTKATLSTDKTVIELTYRRSPSNPQSGWFVTDYVTLP